MTLIGGPSFTYTREWNVNCSNIPLMGDLCSSRIDWSISAWDWRPDLVQTVWFSSSLSVSLEDNLNLRKMVGIFE